MLAAALSVNVDSRVRGNDFRWRKTLPRVLILQRIAAILPLSLLQPRFSLTEEK